MKRIKSTLLLICFLLGALVSPELKPSAVNAASFANLSSGVPVNGTLKEGGSVTYQFTTNADGEVYIVLDQATAGFQVTLNDTYGNYIDSDSFSSGGGTATLDKILLKGTYEVTIEPNYWDGITSASYRLKSTYPGAFTRNSSTFEPNDTYGTSYPVNSGVFYSSKMESITDKDVYRFTTNKDGEAYITLDNASAGLYMTLLDSDGNYIDSDSFSSGGGSSSIDSNLKKGTYYIVIEPNYWSGTTMASYRLRATYSGTFKRDLTTFEPNDTFGTAYPIISGKTYSSSAFSPLDSDVYKLITARDGMTTVTLGQSSAALSLTLFDSYGNYIDSQSFSSGGQVATITEKLKKGTYYVAVNPSYWSGTTSTKYQIKATYPDKTPSINTVSDRSTTITGSAESRSNVYAYVGSKKIGYATSNNSKYSMKITKQKAGTVIRLYLIDSSGFQSGNRYTTVLDKTPPAVPIVNKVTSHSKYVSGKTEKYTTVYVYKGSKYISSRKADSKGYFKVKISKQKKGTILKVYAKDAANNKSAGKSVKVY